MEVEQQESKCHTSLIQPEAPLSLKLGQTHININRAGDSQTVTET